jgi:hypothetical protein
MVWSIKIYPRGLSLQYVNEAIKIHGYNDPPSRNPSPGTFEIYKGNGTVDGVHIYELISEYKYYGIHLDVQCSE